MATKKELEARIAELEAENKELNEYVDDRRHWDDLMARMDAALRPDIKFEKFVCSACSQEIDIPYVVDPDEPHGHLVERILEKATCPRCCHSPLSVAVEGGYLAVYPGKCSEEAKR